MKRSATCKLLLAGIFITLCGVAATQTPFSENPLKISQSAPVANDAPEKLSLWQRIVARVKQGFNKVTSSINKKITDSKLPAFVSKSALIVGHEGREFVCQGICYLPDQVISPASAQINNHNYRFAVLSYYPMPDYTDEPTQLVVVDTVTGKPLKRFALNLKDGNPYTGHAGGIAVAGKYIWVASGYKIYGFAVQAILDFLNDQTVKTTTGEKGIPASFQLPTISLTAVKTFAVDTTASYISFDGKQLWIGDFVKSSDKNFAAVKHHTSNPFKLKTWIAGYIVDADGMPTAKQQYTFKVGEKSRTAHKPDRLIFCRESVQGMAICGNFAALSISYGALNSKLALYNSPLQKAATKISFKPAGQSKTFTADGWELSDDTNWRKTVELPAGSEDLEFDGRYIYVTFEGASQNYRQKWISRNPLIKIENRFYLISPDKILGKKP